jgi:hypothetical protein
MNTIPTWYDLLDSVLIGILFILLLVFIRVFYARIEIVKALALRMTVLERTSPCQHCREMHCNNGTQNPRDHKHPNV